MRCDRIWRNARLATVALGSPGLGVIDDGLVACSDGVIVFAGATREAPAGLDAPEIDDCEGRWITPGLIDCHTHLVYAGNRSSEFELRLQGDSYEAIARTGGGIASTVRSTRAADEEQLVAESLPRLDALLAEGVTTVEIKSGYGLSPEHEDKQLRAAAQLSRRRRFNLAATFLGAHAVPAEFAGRSDDYVRSVCDVMIPQIAAAGLAEAVDAFCEGIGFSPAQVRQVFEAAARHGLRVKVHAE